MLHDVEPDHAVDHHVVYDVTADVQSTSLLPSSAHIQLVTYDVTAEVGPVYVVVASVVYDVV